MKTKLIILIGLLIFSSSTFANEKGKGGDGVVINGKLYLLDFVEAGLENTASIPPLAVPSDPQLIPAFEKFIQSTTFDSSIKSKLVQRLSSLPNNFALTVAATMNLYTFRFVNVALVDIQDEGTLIGVPRSDFRQIAARKGRVIQIDQKLWNQLPANHRVGLIFHETLYALVGPETHKVYDEERNIYVQVKDSSRIRSIVADLFDGTEVNLNPYKGFLNMELTHNKLLIKIQTISEGSRMGAGFVYEAGNPRRNVKAIILDSDGSINIIEPDPYWDRVFIENCFNGNIYRDAEKFPCELLTS